MAADPAKIVATARRVKGYEQGEVVSLMIHLGDRLGIYRALEGRPGDRRGAGRTQRAAPAVVVGMAARSGNSVASCLPSGLSEPGGAGLGTLRLPPSRLQRMCRQAGFSRFQIHDVGDPANLYCEVRPLPCHCCSGEPTPPVHAPL
jgi:hypothetical protein